MKSVIRPELWFRDPCNFKTRWSKFLKFQRKNRVLRYISRSDKRLHVNLFLVPGLSVVLKSQRRLNTGALFSWPLYGWWVGLHDITESAQLETWLYNLWYRTGRAAGRRLQCRARAGSARLLAPGTAAQRAARLVSARAARWLASAIPRAPCRHPGQGSYLCCRRKMSQPTEKVTICIAIQ